MLCVFATLQVPFRLHVSFRRRPPTIELLHKMTYKDKASYAYSPPSTMHWSLCVLLDGRSFLLLGFVPFCNPYQKRLLLQQRSAFSSDRTHAGTFTHTHKCSHTHTHIHTHRHTHTSFSTTSSKELKLANCSSCAVLTSRVSKAPRSPCIKQCAGAVEGVHMQFKAHVCVCVVVSLQARTNSR